MAQLSSPGVSISVIDESMYTSAAPGTVPLIFVASAERRLNGAGTGIAPGTLKQNAGQVYLLTSQKELSDTFGTPVFQTDSNNNPVHAGELNEYGLQAAYSYLGVSSRAYVARADVDLNQLKPSIKTPTGTPADGTYWFDTASTQWGMFTWNGASGTTAEGQTFTRKVPLVLNDPTDVISADPYNTPKASIGAVGTYAVVTITSLAKLWYKKPKTYTPAGTWVEVGSPEWIASIPAFQSIVHTSGTITGSFKINGTSVSANGLTLDDLATAINSAVGITGIHAAVVSSKLELYTTGLDIEITDSTGTNISGLGIANAMYYAPALTISAHTSVPDYKELGATPRPTGSLWIKTTTPNAGADFVLLKYDSASSSWLNVKAPMYADGASALAGLDSTGGGINLPTNTVYVKYNDSEQTPQYANFKLYRRSDATSTTIQSGIVADNTFASSSYSFIISESVIGESAFSAETTVEFDIFPSDPEDPAGTHAAYSIETIAGAINSTMPAGSSIHASVADGRVYITHVAGGEFVLIEGVNSPLAKLFDVTNTAHFYQHPDGTEDKFLASLWSEFAADGVSAFAIPSKTVPAANTPEGLLWYTPVVDEVDILVNDGTKWVGYINADLGESGFSTDANGPIISASKPTLQSTGDPLRAGDLWIDSSDLENYPKLYRYVNSTKEWEPVDTTDQTSEKGIVFADARYNTTGKSELPSTIVDLLTSDFVDFDAPDPALYPKGCLLWNLRRSGNNVKVYRKNYINKLTRNTRLEIPESMSDYYPHRWVSAAANQETGTGSFGRHAQRRVVIQALQAMVNSNQQIRDEEARLFNLIATPGYPELVGEMVTLNYDRGLTAFVIGDTPARLPADATSLSNWGNNQNGALEDGDLGLNSSDEQLAFFYPWGYSSDNIGNNIAVPPSYMMLRTIAISDSISYPWFAPAGTSRGGITNATAVGYITTEGEFQSVALNEGQRDTLASIKVNAITFIAGSGLVSMAQYTRARKATSMDRINVARLVAFLRRQLLVLSRPYLFEPNDASTRAQVKHAADSLMLELSSNRAIYDYIVVCDTSNNTPDRIDRSELYLDIAIEPVKAVEFIYIPLRLKNTGEIKALG